MAHFNEAFDAFDKKKEGKIPSNDLITVFQAMKCNLSKKEEQEYLSVRCPVPPLPIVRECAAPSFLPPAVAFC